MRGWAALVLACTLLAASDSTTTLMRTIHSELRRDAMGHDVPVTDL